MDSFASKRDSRLSIGYSVDYYDGAIFVTGYGSSVKILKYDGDLNYQTSVSEVGSAGTGWGLGVDVDSDGSVYAVGLVNNSGTGKDIWVGKYSSGLTLISSVSISGASNYSDRASGVLADGSGNIYVVGTMADGSQNFDIWIAKFDQSLNLVQSRTVDGSGGGSDAGYGVAKDNSGNIYVTGFAYTGASSQADIFVGKYDSSLNPITSSTFTGTANGDDFGNDIAIDGNDNIFISGFVKNDPVNSDFWVGKLDTSLNLISSVSYSGTTSAGTSEGAYGIGLDQFNNVLVTGSIYGGESGSDILLASFNSNLVLNSSASVAWAGSYDSGHSLATDSNGTIFLVGEVKDPSSVLWISKHYAVNDGQVGSGGRTLTIIPPSGEIRVTVPENSFAEDVNVNLKIPDNIPGNASDAKALTGIGVGIEINVSPPVQPSKRVSLTLRYRDQDVQGLDESKLVVARFVEETGKWISLPSVRNSSNNTVTGLTDHFSTFQIMATAASTSAGDAFIFPNPFRPSLGHNSVTISQVPPNAEIRIFSFSGEEVRSLAADSAGTVDWDGKNFNGNEVGSGVYFVVVKSNGDQDRFKIAIQR